jgi:hypothetical protein
MMPNDDDHCLLMIDPNANIRGHDIAHLQ